MIHSQTTEMTKTKQKKKRFYKSYLKALWERSSCLIHPGLFAMYCIDQSVKLDKLEMPRETSEEQVDPMIFIVSSVSFLQNRVMKC